MDLRPLQEFNYSPRASVNAIMLLGLISHMQEYRYRDSRGERNTVFYVALCLMLMVIIDSWPSIKSHPFTCV